MSCSIAGPLLPGLLETAVWTVGNFYPPLGRLRWGKIKPHFYASEFRSENWLFLLGLTTFYKEAWLHKAK